MVSPVGHAPLFSPLGARWHSSGSCFRPPASTQGLLAKRPPHPPERGASGPPCQPARQHTGPFGQVASPPARTRGLWATLPRGVYDNPPSSSILKFPLKVCSTPIWSLLFIASVDK